MMDNSFPEGMKQTVITRLAALNSAVTFLSLTHGATAVTLDDWLTLAELVEQWVWRGLEPEPPPPHRPSPPPLAVPQAALSTALPPSIPAHNGAPAVPTSSPAQPPPAATTLPPTAAPMPVAESTGQPAPVAQGSERPPKDAATTNQIKAIFGIGKAKGYGTTEVKTWVKGQFNKAIDDLTFREASKLIERLKAL